MARLQNLDLDLLRTFSIVADGGSFTSAGQRVGLTQSAVSLQIRRLEAAVGQRLFARGKGEAVALTPHGRYLLVRAHELLALNDDVVRAVLGPMPRIELRFGVADDFPWLNIADLVPSFCEKHADVHVEFHSAVSCALVPLLTSGKLDLIVREEGLEPRGWPSAEIWRGNLCWVSSAAHAPHLEDPLPLAAGPAHCPWRPPWLDTCRWHGLALEALRAVGRRHRIVAPLPHLDGQLRMVLAGSAVMVSTLPGLAPGLRVLGTKDGLPELPEVRIFLLKARDAPQPATDLLATHTLSAFRGFGPGLAESVRLSG